MVLYQTVVMSDGGVSFYQRIEDFCFVPFVIFIAIAVGSIHTWHVASMFENSQHFSHLSTLEREMTMKTEMGFYYSYYKTIVESNSFSVGLKKVMSDKLVEYPDTVNALKRFNIYPEVIAGYLFHVYSHYSRLYKIDNRQCWGIKRNGHMGEVVSCEGLGEPIYFYLTFIWILGGLTVSLLFIYSLYLSKSVMGGIVAVVCYFYNHSEGTRIQWFPSLRENFAFPFIVLQMMAVTFFLRRMTYKPTEINILQIWILGICGCMCLILWQFSQFILMTQLVLLFIMEQLKIMSRQLFLLLLFGHLIGIYLAVIIMQGNKMLMSSFYLSMTCSMSLNFVFWNHFLPKLNNVTGVLTHILHICKNCLMVFCLLLLFKEKFGSLVGSEDDSHIIQLLKSKLGTFKNFHTMLYTCSAEFDFLPISSIWNLTTTLLLPCAIFNVFMVLTYWVSNISYSKAKTKPKHKKKSKNSNNPTDINTLVANMEVPVENRTKAYNRKSNTIAKSKPSVKITEENLIQILHKENADLKNLPFPAAFIKSVQTEPEIVYNIAQLGIFMIMACMIMRLKLFSTPHLCLTASLITAKRYINRYLEAKARLLSVLFLIILLIGMSVKGVQNILLQRNTVGEFNNEPLEELLTWINTNTEKTAAFAGPMPITSAIMLSTRRPIVNHPHYEDANLRARTVIVYSIFSRQTPIEVFNKLSKLKVTYLVIDDLWCFFKSTRGCTMLDIWDIEEPDLVDSPPLCPYLYLQKSIPHFHRVFSNSQFVVLKLHDNALNIKLRHYEMYSM